MEVNWYRVFSKPEFEATGLVQRTIPVDLEDYGQKDILITKGNTLAVSFDDCFLPVNFLEMNPYTDGAGRYVYLDSSQNVWIGLE